MREEIGKGLYNVVYTVPRDWKFAKGTCLKNYTGLRSVTTISRDKLSDELRCFWFDEFVYRTEGGQFELENDLASPVHRDATVNLYQISSASFWDKVHRYGKNILIPIASLLIAFEVIFGRYGQIFSPVNWTLEAQNSSNIPKFAKDQDLEIPIVVRNLSRVKDRSVEIADVIIEKHSLVSGEFKKDAKHNIVLRVDDIHKTIWEGGQSENLYLVGKTSSESGFRSDQSIEKYEIRLKVKPKSCVLCVFQRFKVATLRYEIWSSSQVEYSVPTDCAGQRYCAVEGAIVLDQSYPNGLKITHKFGSSDSVKYSGVFSQVASDIEVSREHLNGEVRFVKWSVAEPIKKFTKIKFYLALSAIDNQQLSLESWNKYVDKVSANSDIHRMNINGLPK